MLNAPAKIIFLALFFAKISNAQLVPIDEEELSGMAGQAFITMDQSNNNGLDFTKVTLGLDVETSLNSDLLDIGNYNNGSDIKIADFGLGSIDSAGNIMPFKVRNPFIELAYDNSSGTGPQNLVGIRLGFGGAQGVLSAGIASLSGSVDVKVEGPAAPIRDVSSAAWWALSDNSLLTTDAVLIQGHDSNAADYGEPLDYRATYMGIPNGANINCIANCGLLGGIVGILDVNQCDLLGIGTCYALKDFEALNIGDETTNTYAEGLFISFQSQNVGWVDGSTTKTAGVGAFMNIPEGGIQVDFEEALGGIDRVRTRYVDPYFD